MSDVYGRGEVEVEFPGNERAKAKYIRGLLPYNGHDDHRDLSPIAHALEIDGNPYEQANEREASIYPVLRAMVVAGDTVHNKEAQLREADHIIGGDGDSLRVDAVADEIGVVAVDDQQRHDPEDCGALQHVIVVVVVRVLLCIGPGVPCGREDQDEDYEARGRGFFREGFGEVGDLVCCVVNVRS